MGCDVSGQIPQENVRFQQYMEGYREETRYRRDKRTNTRELRAQSRTGQRFIRQGITTTLSIRGRDFQQSMWISDGLTRGPRKPEGAGVT